MFSIAILASVFTLFSVNAFACRSDDSLKEIEFLNRNGISWRASSNSDGRCTNYILKIESNAENAADGPWNAVAKVEIANVGDSMPVYQSDIGFTHFYGDIVRKVNAKKRYEDTIELANYVQYANICIQNVEGYTTSLTIMFQPAQKIECKNKVCNAGTSVSLCPTTVVVKQIENKKDMFGDLVPFRLWEEQFIYDGLKNDLTLCEKKNPNGCEDSKKELDNFLKSLENGYVE